MIFKTFYYFEICLWSKYYVHLWGYLAVELCIDKRRENTSFYDDKNNLVLFLSSEKFGRSLTLGIFRFVHIHLTQL